MPSPSPSLAMLAVLVLAACSVQSERDGVVTIYADPGGSIAERMREIVRMNASGKTYRIAGECISTCTMFLGLDRVCIKPDAEFAFHGPSRAYGVAGVYFFAHDMDEGDRNLWAHQMAPRYPEPIRTLFLDDWSRQPHKNTIRTGAELHQMAPDGVRLCSV